MLGVCGFVLGLCFPSSTLGLEPGLPDLSASVSSSPSESPSESPSYSSSSASSSSLPVAPVVIGTQSRSIWRVMRGASDGTVSASVSAYAAGIDAASLGEFSSPAPAPDAGPFPIRSEAPIPPTGTSNPNAPCSPSPMESCLRATSKYLSRRQ